MSSTPFQDASPVYALAIARVSHVKQREEDQRPGLVRYAEDRQYVLDAVVSVHGRSAFHGRHEKAIIKAVEQHVKKGRCSVVIFRHVDRMSRMKPIEATDFYIRLHKMGARIEFSEQQHLNDRFELIPLFLDMAHQESKVKQDRKLQSNTAKRAKGELIGKIPWGYEPVKKNGVAIGLQPTEAGRTWIPRVFEMAAQGNSTALIAETLNSAQVPTMTGRAWSPQSISRMLANPTYVGQMHGNPNLAFAALVTVTLAKRAQAAIDEKGANRRGAAKQEQALLRPVCGECLGQVRPGAPTGRSPMYRHTRTKNGKQYHYYVCSGVGPQRKSCGAKGIPAGPLDAAVDQMMSRRTDEHMQLSVQPGDDSNEKLERLLQAAAAAMANGDIDAALQLGAQAKEIRPTGQKTKVSMVPSGKTVGEHWQTLSLAEKRDELLRWTVEASSKGVKVFGSWYDDGSVIGAIIAGTEDIDNQ